MTKTDNKISETICKLSVIKIKVNNDIFPCKYSYDSVLDIIDVKFKVCNNIFIILRTLYENNRIFEKTKQVKNMGLKSRNIKKKINKSNKYWCTISIITLLNTYDKELLKENIEFLLNQFSI